MQNKKERPPVLNRLSKPVIPESAAATPEVVSVSLSIIDQESVGYNPYDKPASTPTEAQLDRRLAGRKRTT